MTEKLLQQALNIGGQCKATSASDLASQVLVDDQRGTLSELLQDAAQAIEELSVAIAQTVQPASAVVQEPDAWETQAGVMLKATKAHGELYRWTPLYKHPQAAQPVQPAAVTMSEMTLKDGRQGWYLDLPGIYCDVEREEDGQYTVFFRDKDGGEAFAESASAAIAQPVQPEQNQFNPDWDEKAALVEEIQRMAKQIEKMQLEQEPVATKNLNGITLNVGLDDLPAGTQLFTSPPKREWVGLTDEEYQQIQREYFQADQWRGIEAKLKEKNDTHNQQ